MSNDYHILFILLEYQLVKEYPNNPNVELKFLEILSTELHRIS